MNIKREMQTQSHLARGLVNLLKDDVDCVCIDADTYDLFTINESIREAKDTIARLGRCMEELESIVQKSKYL